MTRQIRLTEKQAQDMGIIPKQECKAPEPVVHDMSWYRPFIQQLEDEYRTILESQYVAPVQQQKPWWRVW